MEKYYRFSNGKIVKRDEKGVFFSLDENGKWILDGHAMSKFYDASSDYVEISNPLESNVETVKQEDKFYMFENGQIIKKSAKNNLFYSLNENKEWVLDSYAIAKFYDASNDYVEISNPNFAINKNNGRNK